MVRVPCSVCHMLCVCHVSCGCPVCVACSMYITCCVCCVFCVCRVPCHAVHVCRTLCEWRVFCVSCVPCVPCSVCHVSCVCRVCRVSRVSRVPCVSCMCRVSRVSHVSRVCPVSRVCRVSRVCPVSRVRRASERRGKGPGHGVETDSGTASAPRGSVVPNHRPSAVACLPQKRTLCLSSPWWTREADGLTWRRLLKRRERSRSRELGERRPGPSASVSSGFRKLMMCPPRLAATSWSQASLV